MSIVITPTFARFHKLCQSPHTCPAVSNPSKEKWDFAASSEQQEIHVRTSIGRYIKIYIYTHTNKIYKYTSLIHSCKK